ncbi:hypothetical protein Hanom_Chr05g00448981 [Helianthus anomalus]
MLKTSEIYIKSYIITLRLGYEKPTAFALRALVLDLVAFVRLSLFKTKVVSVTCECFRPIFCLARWPALHSVNDACDESQFFLVGPGCHVLRFGVAGSWDVGVGVTGCGSGFVGCLGWTTRWGLGWTTRWGLGFIYRGCWGWGDRLG